MTKCEICGERKASLIAVYYDNDVEACKGCTKKCELDDVWYDVDDVYKCFNCERELHKDHYRQPTDVTCDSCLTTIEEEDTFFPYRDVER